MIDKLSWVVVYPELLLLAMACVITLVDLSVKTPKRGGTYVLTLLTLGAVALLHAVYAGTGQSVLGFGGMVVSDPMGHWLKCFAAVAVMVGMRAAMRMVVGAAHVRHRLDRCDSDDSGDQRSAGRPRLQDHHHGSVRAGHLFGHEEPRH